MRWYECDVAVVGGGMAGVAAAVAARQAGANCVLIERAPYLGGTGTHCGVSSFCGFYTGGSREEQIVQGVGEMVLERLRAAGEDTSPTMTELGNRIINYDIEAVKYVLDGLVLDSGVRLLLDARVIDADLAAGRLHRLLAADDEGPFAVHADAFVDATGDGNLAHLAGCPTLFGDEAGKVQMATMEMRLGGVPRDLKITSQQVGRALEQARAAGYGPMTKMRAPMWMAQKGDVAGFTLPNSELKSLDCADMTRIQCETRRMAQAYARALRDFLPGMENSYLLSTGPHVGIRESRRLKCEEMLTVDRVIAGDEAADTRIARGGWPLENHRVLHDMSDNTEIANRGWYGIPLGCLKAVDVSNLWCAGRNICVDHETLASVRVMGTCFATGQAAGVAAALFAAKRDGSVPSVRQELARQGALI